MALIVVARAAGSLRMPRRELLLVRPDRDPAAGRERRPLLRRAQRADGARVADHRVRAALGDGAAAGVARERLPWQVLAGVGVGFAGVAVLAQPSGGAKAWGIALCVLSAVMWSTGSFLSARLPMPDDPFAATAYEMLAGGLADAAVRRSSPCTTSSPRRSRSSGWIYLVIFGSIVGYTAYVWLLANAPLGLVSTYAYVNPVVAITLGVIFRGEHLTWRLLVGAVIVVVAVATVVRREPPSTPFGGEVR